MKMIVMDLDGTLLGNNKMISDNSYNYLKELKDKGYIIVIDTGRILKAALYATKGAGFADYIITDTGGGIYDNNTGKVIFKKLLNKELPQKIFNYFDDSFKYMHFCTENMIYKYTDVFEEREYLQTSKDINYILDKCKDATHLTIDMVNNDLVIDLYNRLLKDMPGLNVIIMQDSNAERKWLEIIPDGCTKYSGIKYLSDYLKIDNKDIIFFGDGLNDIDIVSKCGIGVAINNALPEVKRCSDYVTKDNNDNDGVVKFLMENLVKIDKNDKMWYNTHMFKGEIKNE